MAWGPGKRTQAGVELESGLLFIEMSLELVIEEVFHDKASKRAPCARPQRARRRPAGAFMCDKGGHSAAVPAQRAPQRAPRRAAAALQAEAPCMPHCGAARTEAHRGRAGPAYEAV